MKRLPAIVISLVISLPISAYFVATQPITPAMAVVSSISVILFALPSYLAIVNAKGRGRGLLILGVLGAYALLIESSALATGFPYGDFTYTNVLGNKVFGLTPWTVAFAYPPILLLAFVAARRLMALAKRPFNTPIFLLAVSALTATLAMACDLVLDPAAVRLGFWYWDSPGAYYGVPLVNFAGWLLSGFVGGALLQWLWGKADVPINTAYSGLAILYFWTFVNIWLGQWIPAVIGLTLTLGLTWYLRPFVRTTDSKAGSKRVQ